MKCAPYDPVGRAGALPPPTSPDDCPVKTEALAAENRRHCEPEGRGNLPVRTAKSNNLPGDSHGRFALSE